MDLDFGSIPVESNIYTKIKVGLWAIELDDELPPRMYADENMLSFLGVKERLSPEEIYTHWYNKIDVKHLDEVNTAFDKMKEGYQTEVQYLWHVQIGKTLFFRFGGVRNPLYTKGIRLEGILRDVSKLVHFEKERDEELKKKSVQLKHEKFRTDALTFLARKEPEPMEFVNFFADRLLEISGCDQVIYRNIKGEKIVKNASGIQDVPEKYCEKCPYSTPKSMAYKREILELEDIHHAEIANNPKCPVKSSYNNIVKMNGNVQGMISLHYINNYHKLNSEERETLTLFSQMLSVALGNIEARKTKEEAQSELLASANNIIETFINKYATVYSVDIEDDTFKIIKTRSVKGVNPTKKNNCFSRDLKIYIQTEVSPKDRKFVMEQLEYKNIRQKLLIEKSFDIEYRALQNDVMVWHKMTISPIGTSSEILIGIGVHDAEILISHVNKTIQNEYFGIYFVDLEKNQVRAVKNSKYFPKKINIENSSSIFKEFAKQLNKKDAEFIMKITDSKYVQNMMLNENKAEYVYFSPYSKYWAKITILVLERDESHIPLTIALCFSNVDNLQRENQELSENLQKQIKENELYEAQIEEALLFTNFFVETFSFAIYVNLTDRTAKIYKKSDNEQNDDYLTKDYYKALCDYAKQYTNISEQKRLLKIFSPDFIKDTLRKEKEYTYMFTDVVDSKKRYIRFQVIRGADSNHAAIGFMDVTESIDKEYKYTNTMMSLAGNFQAIYDIDISNGHYIVYSENNIYSDKITANIIDDNDFFGDVVTNIKKVVYRDDQQLVISNVTYDSFKKICRKDTEVSFEYRLLVDEQPQWYQMRIRKSPQEKHHILIGVFNVNEERVHEKEMHEVLNGLASEFTSLYHVDVTTGKFKIFMMASEYKASKIEKLTKSKYENLINALKERFIHPDEKERFLQAADLKHLKKVLANQKSQHTYFQRLCEDGYRWFDQVIVKVQDQNEPLEDFILYYIDCNQQIRDEQEHKQKLQEALIMAQSANLAKTTFLNNMSHDIRTPMNAIMGYTELANKHIDEPEQIKDYLEKIGESSEHLLSLINDVLDMSRIESGKMAIEEKNENLLEIVKNLRDIIKANADQKKLNLKCEKLNMSDIDVVCDKLRLKQILLNVLSNAVKYTPSGGYVYMSVEQIPEKKKGYSSYKFYVKDTGIGMSKKFLETIYEPFTRMQSSTVSGIQGTGLGMTITKNLIDMMGGTIDIKSEIKKGTEVTCTFTFKLQEKNVKKEEKTAVEQVNAVDTKVLEGKKILLVEDNEFNREIAVEILEEQKMVVYTACDGVEAVEKITVAKPGDYDLILMDIQMPVMNGYEATKKIRALGTEVSKLPIIAMTANAFEEDRKLALEAGMDEHLPKPINIPILLKMIEKYL